jgi:hypothetical protein
MLRLLSWLFKFQVMTLVAMEAVMGDDAARAALLKQAQHVSALRLFCCC